MQASVASCCPKEVSCEMFPGRGVAPLPTPRPSRAQPCRKDLAKRMLTEMGARKGDIAVRRSGELSVSLTLHLSHRETRLSSPGLYKERAQHCLAGVLVSLRCL